GLSAQTADVAYFRAVMLPSNEVPATNINAKGAADIIAHLVRDDKGQIISGTVEFFLHVNFPADNNAVGLHIHRGDSTVAGPVVINTGFSAGNSQPLKARADVVQRNAPVLATDATALAALRDLMANPAGFYVNIHTTDFPGGAIRGQLVPAVARVLMGQMVAANEVPAV